MNATNCRKAVVVWLAVVLLSPMLMACGTLEVGIERTPTPDGGATATVAPTPAPGIILPGRVFEFVSYVHPNWRYELSVPNGAKIIHSEYWTTFAYEDTDLIGGSYVLEVEVIPDLDTDSPSALLKQLMANAPDQSPVRMVTVDGGRIRGAAMSYASFAGERCPQTRAFTVVFVAEGQGYALHVKSDAPDRCDAEVVPETAPVVDSFRLVSAYTYKISASDQGKVAFTKEGDVWLWREGSKAVRLTPFGDVRSLTISDDGRIIAFLRGQDVSQTPELWAVNSDGSNFWRLLSADDLKAMVRDDPYALGAGFSGLAWVPSTYTLAFDLMPIYDGLGAQPQDALRLIDADTGAQHLLIAPGEAGDFVYSPDGGEIALITSNAVSLVIADGSNRRVNLVTYPSVGLGETSYRPYPVWAADSRSLRVVVPVTEEFDEVMTFAIWDIPANGTLPTQLGTVEASIFSVRLSPDLERIAFWRPHAPRSNLRDLYLAHADGTGEAVYHTAYALEFLGWAPDSEHFVFSETSGVPQLGHVRGGFAPLADTGVATEVRWVDTSHFLFVTSPGATNLADLYEHGPWELRLGTVGGTSSVIARVEDRMPYYDSRN